MSEQYCQGTIQRGEPCGARPIKGKLSMPLPSPAARRRGRFGRPLRMVELVIDHADAEPEPDDEPAFRERMLRDDSAVVATSPQTATTLDQCGYPESRAQRAERLRAEAARRRRYRAVRWRRAVLPEPPPQPGGENP